jgi:hypothetical protein
MASRTPLLQLLRQAAALHDDVPALCEVLRHHEGIKALSTEVMVAALKKRNSAKAPTPTEDDDEALAQQLGAKQPSLRRALQKATNAAKPAAKGAEAAPLPVASAKAPKAAKSDVATSPKMIIWAVAATAIVIAAVCAAFVLSGGGTSQISECGRIEPTPVSFGRRQALTLRGLRASRTAAVRLALAGTPEQFSNFAAAVRATLPDIVPVELTAANTATLAAFKATMLQALPSCRCALVTAADPAALGKDARHALKALMETGELMGDAALPCRAMIAVRAPQRGSADYAALPDRVWHMLDRYDLEKE